MTHRLFFIFLRLVCFCLLVEAGTACAPAQNTALQNASASDAALPHVFEYQSATRLNSAALAGTFNHWDRNANLMTPDAEGKTWRLTLNLQPGKYLYKFVLNGDTWASDPKASNEGPEGNSVLFLSPPDYARPASPLDGVTAQSALLHLTSLPYLNYDRGQLTLSLRARPGDLKQVWLKVGSRRYPMSPGASDDLYERYSTQIPWDRKHNLTYQFEMIDGPKTEGFGANGLVSSGHVQPFVLKASGFKPFVVPDWVERTVLYQIFPDRFANGNKANDPPDVQPWDAAPTGRNRFGGDVQGIRQHISYLSDLGISAIYFNPVFKSPSNHRYDVEDYKLIDPQFGTNAEFASLTHELQAKHIRTVMDFVFNHSAATFAPFLDVRQKGENSAYKDWYFIKSYPVHAQQPPNYETYGGWWGMPKLNMANPATSDYMLNVVSFWKEQVPLSGLRLDVADAIDMGFWRKLRIRAKSLDPEIWILGERWGDATPWLTGDQWDASMNYPFLFANVDFFAEGKITASEYAKRLMDLYHAYPSQVSRNMMNLLSSHDTARFLTRCHNNQDLDRLAAAVQFTWVGSPSIYYGEELGMQGGGDPDNRRGMTWNLATADNPMLQYYKRLIRLRNSSRALQSGDPTILLTDDQAKTLAYSRTLGDEVAIVALNRSDQPQTLKIPLPQSAALQKARKTGLVDGLTDQRVSLQGDLSITLAPLHAAILLQPATLQ